MIWQLLIAVDWAIITISLFNTITLLWLGQTVMLTADRPRWGTWLGSSGFLLGGLFFAVHTIIVTHIVPLVPHEIEPWWWIAWLPFVSLPLIWYLVIAWYTGVLYPGNRHRFWLAIVSTLGAIALALLLFSDPIPSYQDIMDSTPHAIITLGDIPIVAMMYPIYSILCMWLSIVALRYPAETQRFMGTLARKRAHPWLIATSLVLFCVSLVVSGFVGGFFYLIRTTHLHILSTNLIALVLLFDLLISGLIALAVVLLGQAIVSYEVFTGKTLPRGGLRRYWHSNLIFALSYSSVLAWCLENEINPTLILLLVTIMITMRFSLSAWRSYREYERSIGQLRPFVSSQQLFERITKHANDDSLSLSLDAKVPLQALCDEVLEAEIAYLVPLGPLAPLIGTVVAYSMGGGVTYTLSMPVVYELARQFDSPQTMCVPLEPAAYGGAVWAVPLWGERGLIGMLLLGQKQNEGLYTQEDIEIARATGERLIDTQASAAMAQRLMALQRQRLAESQVLDQRTRRELHDDILPRLHTTMLTLSTHPPNDTINQALTTLTEAHRQIANLLHAMPATSTPHIARLGFVGALRLFIEKEMRHVFDNVMWQCEDTAEAAARAVSPLHAEVVFYAAREAIRNAARYGRGSNTNDTRPLSLTIALTHHHHHTLRLLIEDDGIGIDAPKQHDPNVPKAGSGQGLALHTTMMAVIGGTLTVESLIGHYTRVMLDVPYQPSQ